MEKNTKSQTRLAIRNERDTDCLRKTREKCSHSLIIIKNLIDEYFRLAKYCLIWLNFA